MDQVGDRIFIYHMDPNIDNLVPNDGEGVPYTIHFSHNEDLFIQIPDPVEIPSFPIHHDVRQKQPNPPLAKGMIQALGTIIPRFPGLFRGLRYYFDATDILRPAFFQVLKVEDSIYLYLLRLDLVYKPSSSVVIKPGTNDFTPVYRTRKIFLDADIIPIREMKQEVKGQLQLQVAQAISETWIGETGRGYFVQGIWLDRELTKFFTKLFLPVGKRIYPYFPLNCKFRAICYQPFDLGSEGRKKGVAFLHAARKILEKSVREIEDSMREVPFSEELPAFLGLRPTVPEQLTQTFQPLTMKAYLNQEDLKEYHLSNEAQ